MNTYIVVDDEPLTRMGTIKKVGNFGGAVECIGQASNGQEGLELIERLNPDIIITDMNMPAMDGVEFLKFLTQKYSEKQIIVISGFKDFEYARAAIHAKVFSYLLKPFSREDIQMAMKKAIEAIAETHSNQNRITVIEAQRETANYQLDINLIQSLIMGYEMPRSPVLSSEKFQEISKMNYFTLFVVYSSVTFEQTRLMQFSEEYKDEHFVWIQHPGSSNILFYLYYFNSQPDEMKGVDIANECLKIFKEGTATIGKSGVKTNLNKLNEAKDEGLQALNSSNIFSKNLLICYKISTGKIRSFSWEKENEFIFRIEAGEYVKTLSLLDDLFILFQSRHETLREIKLYCSELIQKSKAIINNYFDNLSSNNMSASVQNILNLLFNIEEIRQYVSRIFTNIAKSMETKCLYGSDDIVENVKTYVNKNYRNDISLDIIASLFSINSTYFSHLFKEKSGENFVDYLNRVRIENAKKLLKNTDTKMYQIAKAVGYDNVKYFFRIFKKVTEMTPERYRGSSES
jgi:Response regulator containing CheY-like receiver domain and AraC-type DNA-binding domain